MDRLQRLLALEMNCFTLYLIYLGYMLMSQFMIETNHTQASGTLAKFFFLFTMMYRQQLSVTLH